MNTTLIILSNLVSSIGGFILGFVVTRIRQRVEEVSAAHIEQRAEEVSEVIVDGDKPVTPPPRKHRLSWRQALGIVVLLLAIGSTITSAMATINQRRIASCQADFNKAYRLAILERADAANRERASVRAMWGALLNPSATTEDRRAAATRYYETLDQGDQTRAKNPLPETDRCE